MSVFVQTLPFILAINYVSVIIFNFKVDSDIESGDKLFLKHKFNLSVIPFSMENIIYTFLFLDFSLCFAHVCIYVCKYKQWQHMFM